VTRRAVAIGLATAVVYVVALAVTAALTPGHTRPLYDGFTAPPMYQWVDPPAFFASGNQPPEPVTTDVLLGPSGSRATGVATPDGQFVLNLGPGAIAPRAGARDVRFHIAPIAPKTLGALPDGLRANGNAYQVTMTAGGTRVGSLDQAGSLVLEIPEVGPNLFWSPTGAHWSRLASNVVPPRDLALSAQFARPGYFLSGTDLPELVAEGNGGTSGSSSVGIVAGVAVAIVAALLLGGAYFLVRRRRNRSPADAVSD
jgi:hypothetical protein